MQKSFGGLFAEISDLPVHFDERQAADRDLNFSNLVMTICLERGRGRLTRDGALAQTIRSWRSIVRFTGEQPILGNDSIDLGGQANRVLQIDAACLDDPTARELNTWLESAECYGTAGIRFLECLRHVDRDDLNRWRERCLSEIVSRSGLTGGRSHHLSMIAVAHALVSIVLRPSYTPGDGLILDLAPAIDDACVIAGKLASDHESAKTHVMRAAEWLADHIVGERHLYLDVYSAVDAARLANADHGRLVGVLNPIPGERVWYNVSEINTELRKAGYSPDRVWTDLARQGALARDGGHRTVRRTIAGRRVRVIAIRDG